MAGVMADSFLWRISLRLMILAWMRTYVAMMQAAMVATAMDLDNPFNMRRCKT